MIYIDLHYNHDIPSGRYQTTVRWQKRDRDNVDVAAQLLGMSTAAFIRTVSHQAASEVFNRLDVLTPRNEQIEGISALRGST